MQKIIFIDVDGTLTNYDGQIPESAKVAIKRARANGHKVYICTGRSKAEIYDEIWNIGLDGMIGGNGSYVEADNKAIMHNHISYEQCVHIVDWLNQRGLAFYLESNNGLFASKTFEEDAISALNQYAEQKGGRKEVSVREVFPTMKFNENLYRSDLNKVSFVLHGYQDYLDATHEFLDLEVNTWGGKGEKALFGDLGVKNISKAYAIDRLLNYLEANRKDTIAFGDAKIDIPMLEYCEIGVAVASGGEEIKAMADYITNAVDEDGIYNAFLKLGLI